MKEKKLKKAMIQTLGCQMNVYDSGRMADMLFVLGYEPTDSPWKADLVVVNTCAIRQKAEQKVFSLVGRLCGIKKRRPHMKIVVAGCVAQQQAEKIAGRFGQVDLILGTRVINRLPDYIKALENREGPIADVEMPDPKPAASSSADEYDADVNAAFRRYEGGVSRYVTIMRGCDNFCSYCVVPYVRGREESRPPQHILDEIKTLVSAGTKEVTLLGQNVNSYGKKEKLTSFAGLLRQAAEIEGLERIRFVTSHPKDLSEELVDAYSGIEKLCNHIHLPVQSGSDAVLKRMNRKYTRDSYMERIERLRSIRPDIAVTTDVIVGFPGETRRDFEATLDLLERVGFDTLFAFEYSDRLQAPARKFGGKVDPGEKSARLKELLGAQEKITRSIYENLVGKTMNALVEGCSKHGRGKENTGSAGRVEMTGRTPENRIVNFEIDPRSCGLRPGDLIGKTIPVQIYRPCANSLKGKMPVEESAGQQNTKGGKIHAA
ncbi:MAG: tRNA (N6-isopentenyl adenosine(37)-C2)-methylthiotransferase MiaB [Desulfobacteraceae bacterium]|nr:tRNA (N6-isopentenyl adenosine(37)-C2)-methylthiotransferase MiaB [Desulfobacteraceae bacterium]